MVLATSFFVSVSGWFSIYVLYGIGMGSGGGLDGVCMINARIPNMGVRAFGVLFIRGD